MQRTTNLFKTFVGLSVILLLAGPLAADQSKANPSPAGTKAEETPRPTEEAQEDQANRAALAKLQKQSRFEFDGVDLQSVVDFIREVSGVNIVVDWNTLEQAGIDRTATTVTLTLADVTCEKMLKEVLATTGGAMAPLGFILDEGVLRISTKENLDSHTALRVYDVEDLIADVDVTSRAKKLEDLRNVIQENINPKSWIENGGTIGALQEFGGLLVITQTLENQRAVDDLLGDLRRAKAHRPATPRQKAHRTQLAITLVDKMKGASFDPASVGLIAVGGLRDDVQRDAGEIIADLESQLPNIGTLGLRNAIRLTLRDLYKQTGNDEKVLEHLRAMLAENDAVAARKTSNARAAATPKQPGR